MRKFFLAYSSNEIPKSAIGKFNLNISWCIAFCSCKLQIRMGRFYTVYAEIIIGQSPITQFNSNISWMYHIQLMRIANEDERRFYELETANSGWLVKELQLQFDVA
jgi:Uncharacterized conserved protein